MSTVKSRVGLFDGDVTRVGNRKRLTLGQRTHLTVTSTNATNTATLVTDIAETVTVR